MNQRFSDYTQFLVDGVHDKINEFFLSDTIENIIQNNIMIPHFYDKGMFNYHKYYFNAIWNDAWFSEKENFFREFAQKNKIKGLSNDFFDRLEKNRKEILTDLRNWEDMKVYTRYFCCLDESQVFQNNCNSLFSKLVHMVWPDYFCMLDNKIKTYFGLENESFNIAFCAISEAYHAWWDNYLENHDIMNTIGRYIIDNVKNLPIYWSWKEDNDNRNKKKRLTEMKILDMIFYAESRKTKPIYY